MADTSGRNMVHEITQHSHGSRKPARPFCCLRHLCTDVLLSQGFYNPLSDTLIEPDHTGISYSFTSDGYYEEAYYRALAQPVNPSCPQGMMQWQHGQYAVNATGSIFLTPIAVDGRQLISNPCGGSSSIYTRYNNSEVMSVSTIRALCADAP